MSATREDYELAAKAAGMKVTFREYGGERFECVRHIEQHGLTISTSWNPRQDDGDSRRLQVDCGIDLELYNDCALADIIDIPAQFNFFSDHKNDKCEAARHAVFGLAVEIGRGMK
jgi:hypothetical protein